MPRPSRKEAGSQYHRVWISANGWQVHEGAGSMETEISRIASWLQPQDILLDVDVRDRAQLFERVATTIGGANGLDPAPIRRALERREQVGSTALGDRFAVPHACIAGITRPLTLYI